MNDKELAGKAVAILGWEGPNNYNAYGFPYESGVILWMHPHDFVRDWRVAGALMEKVEDFILERSNGGLSLGLKYKTHQPGTFWKRGSSVSDESLPRAIIEACCEALDD